MWAAHFEWVLVPHCRHPASLAPLGEGADVQNAQDTATHPQLILQDEAVLRAQRQARPQPPTREHRQPSVFRNKKEATGVLLSLPNTYLSPMTSGWMLVSWLTWIWRCSWRTIRYNSTLCVKTMTWYHQHCATRICHSGPGSAQLEIQISALLHVYIYLFPNSIKINCLMAILL